MKNVVQRLLSLLDDLVKTPLMTVLEDFLMLIHEDDFLVSVC